ncbi:hypothetical protein GCM10007973_15360 [Polymorphobacter multimanifer]|nr:hypothetical protein GCM10007973_15360 [Polymorphobacter multimanifer]
MRLHGMADVAERGTGLGNRNGTLEALMGDLDEAARLQRHITDEIHAARVAVPAIDDDGDGDVDDIPVLELLCFGRDAVADDMVGADAQAVREAAVEDGGGRCTGGADEFPRHAVEIERHHTGHDVRGEHVEHLRGQLAGAAHAFEACRAVQPDMAFAGFEEGRGLVHDFTDKRVGG